LPDINIDSYKQKYTKQYREITDVYLCRNKIIKTHIILTNIARITYRAFKKMLRIKTSH